MSTGKVLKNSLIYSVTSILQKAIGFFLLPVYTAYLSTTEYGIVGMITTMISFLSLFVMLALHGAASFFTSEYLGNKKKIKKLWGTILTFIVVNGSLVILFVALTNKFLLSKILKDIEFNPYILIGLITTFLNSIYMLYQCYLQTLQEGKKYGLNNFIYFLINTFLSITLIVFLKMGVLGLLLATMITNVVFVIYTLIDFVPRIKLGIDKEIFKKSIKYSLPLLPHSLSGWIMAMIDRVFLNNLQSLSSVGLYNIGFQFGNLINIVIVSVAQAFTPHFFQLIKDEKKNRGSISKFVENFIVLYSLGAFFISFFVKDVLKIMVSSEFKESWIVVPILAFSNVFNGVYYMFVNVLFAKNTKIIPIITFVGAGINTIFNIILIKKYGYIGAAISSFVSLFITSLFTYFWSQKYIKIKVPIFKIYSIILTFFLVSMTSFFNINLFVKILISILLLLLIFVIYKKDISIYIEIIKFKFSKNEERK